MPTADYHKGFEASIEPDLRRMLREQAATIARLEERLRVYELAAWEQENRPAAALAPVRKIGR